MASLVLIWSTPPKELSQRQLDRVADILSGYASDLRKGREAYAGLPIVTIPIEPDEDGWSQRGEGAYR